MMSNLTGIAVRRTLSSKQRTHMRSVRSQSNASTNSIYAKLIVMSHDRGIINTSLHNDMINARQKQRSPLTFIFHISSLPHVKVVHASSERGKIAFSKTKRNCNYFNVTFQLFSMLSKGIILHRFDQRRLQLVENRYLMMVGATLICKNSIILNSTINLNE